MQTYRYVSFLFFLVFFFCIKCETGNAAEILKKKNKDLEFFVLSVVGKTKFCFTWWILKLQRFTNGGYMSCHYSLLRWCWESLTLTLFYIHMQACLKDIDVISVEIVNGAGHPPPFMFNKKPVSWICLYLFLKCVR